MSKSIAKYAVICLSMAGASVAHASDRELRAVLDRLACVPERITSATTSTNLVIHEVLCKRTNRILQIACLQAECWLLTPRRQDDDERGIRLEPE